MKKVEIEITDLEAFADKYIPAMQKNGYSRQEMFAVKNFVNAYLNHRKEQ